MEEDPGMDANGGAKFRHSGGREAFGKNPVGAETAAACRTRAINEGQISRRFALERLFRRATH